MFDNRNVGHIQPAEKDKRSGGPSPCHGHFDYPSDSKPLLRLAAVWYLSRQVPETRGTPFQLEELKFHFRRGRVVPTNVDGGDVRCGRVTQNCDAAPPGQIARRSTWGRGDLTFTRKVPMAALFAVNPWTYRCVTSLCSRYPTSDTDSKSFKVSSACRYSVSPSLPHSVPSHHSPHR